MESMENIENVENVIKENTIPDILMPLLIGGVPISGIMSPTNSKKVLKLTENDENNENKPRILVKKDSYNAAAIGMGFYTEKGINNEYVDIFVIATGTAYESKWHRISTRNPGEIYASLGFPSICFVGQRHAEVPISKSGAYVYTDTQGTSQMMSCDEIRVEVRKKMYAYNTGLRSQGYKETWPNGIKYIATRPGEKLISEPYVPIGIRIFKNHKIFTLYGKGIPNQDGSVNNKVYMARHSKKALSKSVDFIDAITIYDKNLLDYVEGYHRVLNGTLVYDARVIPSHCNKEYDLSLLGVSGILTERTVQLHPETIDTFISVFGEESCKFECDLEEEDTSNPYAYRWQSRYLGYSRITNFKTLSYVNNLVRMSILGGMLAKGFEKTYHTVDDKWCVDKNHIKSSIKPKLDSNTRFKDGEFPPYSSKECEILNKLLDKLSSTETDANTGKSTTKKSKKPQKPKNRKIDDGPNPTSKAAIDRVNLKNITALMDNNKLFITEKDVIGLSKLAEHSSNSCVYCRTFLPDILNIRNAYRCGFTGNEGDICMTDIVEYNGMLYNVFKDFKIFTRNTVSAASSSLRLLESDIPPLIENKGVMRVYFMAKQCCTLRGASNGDYCPLTPLPESYNDPDRMRNFQVSGVELELALEKITIIPVTRGSVNYYEYRELSRINYGRGDQMIDSEIVWSSVGPGYIWKIDAVNDDTPRTILACSSIKQAYCGADNQGMQRVIFDIANILDDSRSGLKNSIPKHQICSKILLNDKDMRDIYLSKTPKGYWVPSSASLRRMIVSNVMIPKTKYIRTAFEQGDVCGIDRRLIYVLGKEINWVHKTGVNTETAKNKYYRSLSDIFGGLPHNKVKILANCFDQLIKNHGLFGCYVVCELIRFLSCSDSATPSAALILAFAAEEYAYRWGGRRYQDHEGLTSVNLASLSDEQFTELFTACANLSEACCDAYAKPKSGDSMLFGSMESAYITNLLAWTANIIKLYNPNGTVKTLLTKTKIFIDTLSLLVRNMSNGYAPLDETLLRDTLRQISINKRNNGEVADWALDELFRLATSTESNIWRQLESLEQRIINENNRINTSAEEKTLLENYKTKVYPKISKLAYENEKYAIVVPSELADLRTEGSKLHHCVGSYVSSVGRGQTTIVFLRQKENLDTPFMTCEIYQNSIRQIHGLMNNNIKDQKDPVGINNFITEWCEINKISYLNNADRVLAAAVR